MSLWPETDTEEELYDSACDAEARAIMDDPALLGQALLWMEGHRYCDNALAAVGELMLAAFEKNHPLRYHPALIEGVERLAARRVRDREDA